MPSHKKFANASSGEKQQQQPPQQQRDGYWWVGFVIWVGAGGTIRRCAAERKVKCARHAKGWPDMRNPFSSAYLCYIRVPVCWMLCIVGWLVGWQLSRLLYLWRVLLANEYAIVFVNGSERMEGRSREREREACSIIMP